MPRALALASRALPAIAALLLTPAAAGAAVRYAAADADAGSRTCSLAAPCRIDVAVEDAAAGDEVVVAPGTYSVAHELSPSAPITLRGVAGRPRPRLVSAAGFEGTLLSFRQSGTLRHLRIEVTAPGQDALTLERGLAEDLILLSAAGDGGKVVGSEAGTVLRDSLVQTAGAGAGAAGLKLRESGESGGVTVLGVTVLAPSATGIRCELEHGDGRLVNAIVRGSVADVDASKAATGHCGAAASNLRASLSPGLQTGAGMQESEPLFVDAAGGDYRPAPGSPTIDAGAADPLLGGADLAGCPRALGKGPDIGAYEYADPIAGACAPPFTDAALPARVPSGPGTQPAHPTADDTPAGPLNDVLRGVPAPVLGATVVVAPGRGRVLVRRPGRKRFRVLDGSAQVPVGSVFDARAGRVRLVSAVDADGRLQMGTFWGAKFQVRQWRKGRGMTALHLRGGSFRSCRGRHTAAAADRVVAAAAGKRRRKRIRRLWSRDHGGRFRTHGQNSAATARGTRWLTVDRCDGTLTRVTEGAVSVRDRGRGRTVLVRAGHSYLARR